MKKFKLVVLLVALLMLATVGFTACKVEPTEDPCAEGHTYVNGVCTVCEAEDPDYVAPATPEELLAQAKTAALAAIEEGYNTLIETYDYYTADRASLDAAKDAAIVAVNAATDQDGLVAAKDAAVDALNAITHHEKTYTYRQYASSFPNGWNPHSYQTNDEGGMLAYFQTSFFEFDYKLDDNDEIVPGEFVVNPIMAADFPEDVTAQFAGQYDIPADKTEGYAWKITLREGLTWNDGTPIVAEDFIYSMKEQLNPLFMHYRADSYYASTTPLSGAEGYVKQGQILSGKAVGNLIEGLESSTEYDKIEAWLVENGEGNAWINWDYSFGAKVIFTEGAPRDGWGKLNEDGTESWNTAAPEDKVVYSGATINDVYNLFCILSGGAYKHYFASEVFVEVAYPEVDFDTVGIKAVEGDPLSFYYIMNLPLTTYSSHYQWAYDFGGNWLVKEDVYEALKVAPTVEGELWTSTYGTSVETTPSFGPYVLETFQMDTEYSLVRNENWFGYDLEINEGKYQTDAIYCRFVQEWETAWGMFQRGQLDGIGITVDIAAEYKGSSRAYFNPDDYVSTMQVQSSLELLTAAEDEKNAEAGFNKYDKQILSLVEFRKALSLAYDRVDFTAKTTTASQVGFGLFGPAHYYNVQEGKVYRNEDLAKKVICDVYAVNVEDYASIDEAYDAVTGYDLATARDLIDIAVTKAVEAGYMTEDAEGNIEQIVFMLWGSSVDNANTRRAFNYIKPEWEELMVGTRLEGKFEIDFNGDSGDDFSDWFRDGTYDILMAGWSGAAWNPFYLIMAYIDDGYKYAVAYDETEVIELTVPGFDFDPVTEGVQETYSMAIIDWYKAINALHSTINITEVDQKLVVLAELERDVLEEYISVPTAYAYDAALRSYKIEAYGDEYHVFMGWGGLRYYTYNYTDIGFENWVATQQGPDGESGVINYQA